MKWSDIDTKNRTSGSIKVICPECSHTRKKKKDPCLSVNLDKGAAKCWHCEATAWREEIKPKKEFKLPPQQWQNFTSLSDKLVKWFKSRGITQQTLIANKITQEEVFMPAEGKMMRCVAFNYFEGSKLLNKKYRSAKKQFTQVKDAKKTFYGLNDIVEASEIYIVEGEMDKLSMFEIGVENCISVPNGANDLNDVLENCEHYLNGVEKYYIAVDMDAPGQKLEKEISKRLGRHKCERITFKGKDANEDLIAGVLEKSLKTAKPYPVEGTFTAADVRDDIMHLYDHGMEAPLKLTDPNWADLDEKFRIMMGQLTVVTGIPGHGKSNWLEWYVLSLSQQHDLKVSFYSPEHLPQQLHHSQLAEKYIGKHFHSNSMYARMGKADLQRYEEWSKKRIYLTVPESGKRANWDWLLSRFEEQIFRFGIDIFVIDAFNKVLRENADSLGEIGEILSRLTMFCQKHNVHIFLVAHPTKMRKKEDGITYHMPTLYDVKGSGDFYDQAHNGLTVYRNYEAECTTVVTTKIKFKHQGVAGAHVHYKFNLANGRYKSLNGYFDNEILGGKNTEQTSIITEAEKIRAAIPPCDF